MFFIMVTVEIGKRANLKTGVTRKQSTPIFAKNEHFLPPDTYTYVRNTRFEICPLALLPTIYT